MTIKIYGTYPPYANQTDTHNYISSLNFNYNGQVVVIKSSRQIYGKTQFCIAELIRHSLSKKSDCVFMSPTYQQAMENHRKITTAVPQLIDSSDKTTLNIQFTNGSRIRFFSSQQNQNIRGITVKDLLIIDEAAFIEDDVWYEILSPTTAKHKPLVIMTSTPYFKSGFFYNYFISNNPNIKVFDWVRDYPQNLEDNKSFLLEQQKMLPPLKFQTEYLGEWLEDDATSLFKLTTAPFSSKPTKYVGIDFGAGVGKDYTVVVGFDEDYHQTILYYDNKLEPIQSVEWITNLLSNYTGEVIAESNSIGSIYINLLKKKLKIKAITTTNENKREMIERLITMTHNNQIVLVDDLNLIKQFNNYQMQKTDTGKITYNAKSGYNDDIVMATALAIRKQTKYNIL